MWRRVSTIARSRVLPWRSTVLIRRSTSRFSSQWGARGDEATPLTFVGRQLLDQARRLRPLEEAPERRQAAVHRGGLTLLHIQQVAAVLADIGRGDGLRAEGLPHRPGEPASEVEQVQPVGMARSSARSPGVPGPGGSDRPAGRRPRAGLLTGVYF